MKVKVYTCLVAAGILFAGCSNNSEKTDTKPKQDSSATQQEKKDVNSVTLDQFSKIKTDMTYEEVKKIMGSEGRMGFEKGEKGTDTYSAEYGWEIKDPKSVAIVTFLGGKVSGKSQEGLQ